MFYLNSSITASFRPIELLYMEGVKKQAVVQHLEGFKTNSTESLLMNHGINSIKIEDLFNGMSIPSFIVKDNQIIKCNPQFSEEFFNPEIDPINKSFSDINIWASEETKNEIIEELASKKRITNKLVQLRNALGVKNKYLLTIGLIDGDEKFIIGSAMNVTELIDQNSKYIKLQNKYSELLNSTQTSMVLIDEDFKIKECNKAFLDLIDSKTESIIGNDMLFLFECNTLSAFNGFKKKLKEMALSGETVFFKNVELQIMTLNNTIKWVFINTSTYGDNQIVLIINEITDVKITESKKYISGEKSKDKLKQGLLSLITSIRQNK